ncbi:response regulator [Anoxynatronum buryatiense]|uniref:Stage 0 sporulation protein A homolog n=1 Tax=Anoxynatronum buryatiense TaxID=489973 RepID=A0AA46AJI6_9CLOT|nr:response regulator [Anoxynatronum buryatiense]SMP60546.1 Transcriptional regulatory protein, C terminal [Anoxynatronum buryatiense]
MINLSEPEIILVDDESLTLRNYELVLKSFFGVKAFSDPVEALKYMDRESVKRLKVIISDAWMPDMTGAELLFHMSKRIPEAMRMIVTGMRNFEVAKESINKGKVHCFLNKPVKPETLIFNTICCCEQLRVRRVLYHSIVSIRLEETEKRQMQWLNQFFVEQAGKEADEMSALIRPISYYYKALNLYRNKKYTAAIEVIGQIATAHDDRVARGTEIRKLLLEAAVLWTFRKPGNSQGSWHYNRDEVVLLLRKAADVMAAHSLNGMIAVLMEEFSDLMQFGIDMNVFSQKQAEWIRLCLGKDKRKDWSVQTLGTLVIWYKGETVKINDLLTRKEIDVLTYLLSRPGQRIPADMMIEHFWPHKSFKQGKNNLYLTLHTLRKTLEPDLNKPKHSRIIQYHDNCCFLNTTHAAIQDLELTELMTRAQDEWSKGLEKAFLETCQLIISNYRQPYLCEYIYEHWISERRYQIQSKFHELLLKYTQLLEKQQRKQEAQLMLKVSISNRLVLGDLYD